MSETNARKKKLMVTVKLELDDAVQIRWLAEGPRPAKGYRPRLRSIQLPDGGPSIGVDSKHVSEVVMPTPDRGKDDFDAFFMGYFEVEPEDAAYQRLLGKKDVVVDYELGFVDDAEHFAEEGRAYQVLAKRPAKVSAMG
jgi:hypothetical protein